MEGLVHRRDLEPCVKLEIAAAGRTRLWSQVARDVAEVVILARPAQWIRVIDGSGADGGGGHVGGRADCGLASGGDDGWANGLVVDGSGVGHEACHEGGGRTAAWALGLLSPS